LGSRCFSGVTTTFVAALFFVLGIDSSFLGAFFDCFVDAEDFLATLIDSEWFTEDNFAVVSLLGVERDFFVGVSASSMLRRFAIDLRRDVVDPLDDVDVDVAGVPALAFFVLVGLGVANALPVLLTIADFVNDASFFFIFFAFFFMGMIGAVTDLVDGALGGLLLFDFAAVAFLTLVDGALGALLLFDFAGAAFLDTPTECVVVFDAFITFVAVFFFLGSAVFC
jgi:hypothetical protein